MVTKCCSRKDCIETNPQLLSGFGKSKRTKIGLRSECNSCRRIETSNQYKANPDLFLKRNARWAARNPQKAKKAKIEAELNQKPYRRFKKDICENPSCNFEAIDSCQLDVDHIDGNRNNNDSSNLQTLCANCHRLKTKEHKNGIYSGKHMRLYATAS